jgi:GTP cyclohydrolase I
MPDVDRAARALEEALDALGFRGEAEMDGTAGRVAALLAEFAPGRAAAPVSRSPAGGAVDVIIAGVPFHALCAHHLLPFFGEVTVAYRPDAWLAGLGAVPRLVEAHARRATLQETLADGIAGALWDAVSPRAVVVRVRARQMCVEMRGARSPADVTVFAHRGGDAPDERLLRGMT